MRKTRLSRREFLFGFKNRFSQLDVSSNPSPLINKKARDADVLLQQGEFTEAKEILQELVKERSDNLVARQKLAYCLYKIGEIGNAKQEFLKLIQLGVKNNFISLYLGLCFVQEDRLKEAIEVFKGFFDITKPIIQRAINLQIALYDSNMANKEDMRQCIEEAICEQNKMDENNS